MTTSDAWRLLRPQQWIKNGFVVLPVVFGGRLTDGGCVGAAVVTFVIYSLTASSVYCFNDIVDCPSDRRHPVKCRRPIASGRVTLVTAYALMALLLVAAAALLPLLGEHMAGVAVVIGTYYVMNLCYCAVLKRYAIVDVTVVAVGFVLRLLAGGIATATPLSRWIVLMTFLLALFLSLAKRRDDVLRMERTGEAPRRSVMRYNLSFVNEAMTVTGSVMIVCYIMYCMSPDVMAATGCRYTYVTALFVIAGLLRYLQLANVDNDSGDPTRLVLHDGFLLSVVVLWVVSHLIIIYVLPNIRS